MGDAGKVRGAWVKRPIAAGLVAAVVLLPAAPAFAAGKVTAVYYKNPPGATTNTSLNKEYVVIRNSGKKALNMTGWLLKDKQHAGEPANVYKFPKFRLGPGKSVRVHTGKGKNGATNLYMGLTSYVWSDSGDTAILEKKSGHVVSTCGWTSTDSSPKFC